MRDTSSIKNLVGQVEAEFALLHDESEEVENVARIELARVHWNFGGQIQWRQQRNTAYGLRNTGQSQLTVASGGRGEVD